jgi:hypothetical protein
MRSSSRSRKLASALTLLAILALVGGLIAAGGGESRAPDDPPGAVTKLTVGSTAVSRAVPPGFLGLSIEYPTVEGYAGSDPRNLNTVLTALIGNLAPGQAPVLRIGGDSSDRTWWPVPGLQRPAGVSYSLDSRWIAVTRALQQALGARLILGVNLEANSAAVASAEAQALMAGLGRSSIEALELGNEPNLYATFPWYVTAQGRPVNGRGRDYSFDQYLNEYRRTGAGLPAPLAGPTAGGVLWLNYLAPFLLAEPKTGLVTLHRYPLQLCTTPPASPQYPTLANLLASASSTGLANGVVPDVTIAHAHGLQLRIDEMNSVACGSASGVSQTFASALWAVDALFEMARVGVDGVNIHTFPGAGYELFRFTNTGGRWSATISPEYYGLLMFAQSVPAGSRLSAITGALPAHLKAWAVRTGDGQTRVVLINEDTRAHAVSLRGAGLVGPGTLSRLQASGLTATSGVTLGGQSFGSETQTGLLFGPAQSSTVRPTAGQYRVTVPAASAATLTFMRNG